MTGHVSKLPVLVINPHSLCNCRCAMCDIWKRTRPDEIGPRLFDDQLEDIQSLGVEWVVFSGGEPLLHADLFRKASELRRRGIRVTLLSSGLLLSRHAQQIVDGFSDLIVSLDGPRAIHDRIRGVTRAFGTMASGVERLHSLRPEFPVSARCTVQRLNCAHLTATVAAGRDMGLASISFLASDLHSTAFNRQALPVIDGLSPVALTGEDLPVLEAEIDALIERGLAGGFVLESPEKLRRIALHFRCALTGETPVAPRCNAPWNSAVVEADGAVRPCFFQSAFGRIAENSPLAVVLNGEKARAFRKGLNVEADPICRKCVCSLYWSK